MNEQITITICGDPIAQKRPRFSRQGKFVRVYSCQETEAGKFRWDMAHQADGIKAPQGVPVALACDFIMPIPSSISQKKKEAMDDTPHVKKPDLDNLVKFVKDCANGVLWDDDSQVCNLTAAKRYGQLPRTIISIAFDRA